MARTAAWTSSRAAPVTVCVPAGRPPVVPGLVVHSNQRRGPEGPNGGTAGRAGSAHGDVHRVPAGDQPRGEAEVPQGRDRAAAEAAGCTDVETYINTGNVRFDTTMRSRAKIEAALEKAFAEEAGFEVPTIVFTPKELVAIADEAEALRPPRAALRLPAQGEPSAAAVKKVEERSTADEVAKVGGRAVHLLLGENYHEARLTNAVVEKHLGVATNRNLTVIRTLAERWGGLPSSLGAAERRLPLLAERTHALGDVGGAEQDRLTGALALQGALELGEGGRVDRLLGGGERQRGTGREAGDEASRRGRELGVAAEVGDQPGVVRLRRAAAARRAAPSASPGPGRSRRRRWRSRRRRASGRSGRRRAGSRGLAATTRSAARAAEQPTPAATPLTAATTGLSSRMIARMIRLAASSARTSKCSWASAPEMSAPVLKAAPVPVSTTTRTSSRAVASSTSRARSSAISALSALRTSGRLRVSHRAPPSTRSSRSANGHARLRASRRGPRPSSRARRRRTGRAAPGSSNPAAAASSAVARTQ